MGNLLKMLLGGSACLAIVVMYFVLGKQEHMETKMDMQVAQFDETMANKNADFARDRMHPRKNVVQRYEKSAAMAHSDYSTAKMAGIGAEKKHKRDMKDLSDAVHEGGGMGKKDFADLERAEKDMGSMK